MYGSIFQVTAQIKQHFKRLKSDQTAIHTLVRKLTMSQQLGNQMIWDEVHSILYRELIMAELQNVKLTKKYTIRMGN